MHNSNDSFCPKCGKPRRRLDHFDDFNHFKHHQSVRYHDDFICDRFICDDRFKVRLGGLQGGLNFRLRQLIDCEVKMEVVCGGESEEIDAKICFVGSDFVEVKVLDKKVKEAESEEVVDEVDVQNHENVQNHDDVEKDKKKKKKDDFLIIPTVNVKSFKFKDDCDCDCHKHYRHHDCDCHKHHHHDCNCECHKHHKHHDCDCDCHH